MKRKIVSGEKYIEYELQRKNVKNINLRIRRDGSVFVSAGRLVSEKAIDAFVLSKAEYILRASARRAELEKYAPEHMQYADGEMLCVFGQYIPIKLLFGDENKVECDGKSVLLTVKNDDRELKMKLIEKWLDELCKSTVTSICKAAYPSFERYGIAPPEIRFRKMVSRWGSCQVKKGVLTFAYALSRVPLPAVEYVVFHEFTHLLQPDHSKAFYRQLALFMPDHQERKKLLER